MGKALSLLVVIFFFSCENVKHQTIRQTDDPLANKFQLIHGKLQRFADKHGAKISTVWGKVERHNPDGSDSYLVKHIVWYDGRYGKGVFIQQHHSIERVDTTAWDISNIAWLQDTQSIVKPTYEKKLLSRVDFRIIERDIEKLLQESEEVLSQVKEKDLK